MPATLQDQINQMVNKITLTCQPIRQQAERQRDSAAVEHFKRFPSDTEAAKSSPYARDARDAIRVLDWLDELEDGLRLSLQEPPAAGSGTKDVPQGQPSSKPQVANADAAAAALASHGIKGTVCPQN